MVGRALKDFSRRYGSEFDIVPHPQHRGQRLSSRRDSQGPEIVIFNGRPMVPVRNRNSRGRGSATPVAYTVVSPLPIVTPPAAVPILPIGTNSNRSPRRQGRMSGHLKVGDPFTKVFWEDQQELITKRDGTSHYGKKTDVKITCNDGHFFAHRAVILSGSDFLQTILEGHQNEEMADILFWNFKLANVKAVMTVFYLGRIPLSDTTDRGQIDELCVLLGLKNLVHSPLTAEERKCDNLLRGFSYDPDDFLVTLPPPPPDDVEQQKRRRSDDTGDSSEEPDSPWPGPSGNSPSTPPGTSFIAPPTLSPQNVSTVYEPSGSSGRKRTAPVLTVSAAGGSQGPIIERDFRKVYIKCPPPKKVPKAARLEFPRPQLPAEDESSDDESDAATSDTRHNTNGGLHSLIQNKQNHASAAGSGGQSSSTLVQPIQSLGNPTQEQQLQKEQPPGTTSRIDTNRQGVDYRSKKPILKVALPAKRPSKPTRKLRRSLETRGVEHTGNDIERIVVMVNSKVHREQSKGNAEKVNPQRPNGRHHDNPTDELESLQEPLGQDRANACPKTAVPPALRAVAQFEPPPSPFHGPAATTVYPIFLDGPIAPPAVPEPPLESVGAPIETPEPPPEAPEPGRETLEPPQPLNHELVNQEPVFPINFQPENNSVGAAAVPAPEEPISPVQHPRPTTSPMAPPPIFNRQQEPAFVLPSHGPDTRDILQSVPPNDPRRLQYGETPRLSEPAPAVQRFLFGDLIRPPPNGTFNGSAIEPSPQEINHYVIMHGPTSNGPNFVIMNGPMPNGLMPSLPPANLHRCADCGSTFENIALLENHRFYCDL